MKSRKDILKLGYTVETKNYYDVDNQRYVLIIRAKKGKQMARTQPIEIVEEIPDEAWKDLEERLMQKLYDYILKKHEPHLIVDNPHLISRQTSKTE